MSTPVKHFYEFGSFRLDPEQRSLWRGGQAVPLPPKVFDTLLVLVERRDRVVGKEEMMSLVWPDRYVEESNLTQNIFTLRKILGEGQGKERYIDTVRVPQRGYRFIIPVKEVQESGLFVALDESEVLNTGLPSWRAETIAVLPMVNETDDPKLEYLSEGITESIITCLSQLSQMHVIPRSLVAAHKGKQVDALKIGRELKADVVLLTRVIVQGGELIIRAELVEVSSGWQLWGELYHTSASDILTVQDEVSRNISAKLHLKLTEEDKKLLGKHYTENAKAYEAYLKGRHSWNKRTGTGHQEAIEYFEEAIKLDPGYALAHSALAHSYVTFDLYGVLPTLETRPKAKEAAIKALLIDDSLAEAHTSLACVKMMYETDWSNAEKEFKRAIELDRNYAPAHNWYSHFLMAMGRIDESLEESQIALNLDPLDDSVNQSLGWRYLKDRPFDRAIDQLEKTLADNPEFFLARFTLGMAYDQKRDLDKAIAEFQKAYELENNTMVLAFLGHAYARAGDRESAEDILRELEELSGHVYVPPSSIALIHAGLGKKDETSVLLGAGVAAPE